MLHDAEMAHARPQRRSVDRGDERLLRAEERLVHRHADVERPGAAGLERRELLLQVDTGAEARCRGRPTMATRASSWASTQASASIRSRIIATVSAFTGARFSAIVAMPSLHESSKCRSRQRTEAAALDVGDGLLDLLHAVHHERSVLHDGLVQRLPREDDEVRLLVCHPPRASLRRWRRGTARRCSPTARPPSPDRAPPPPSRCDAREARPTAAPPPADAHRAW